MRSSSITAVRGERFGVELERADLDRGRRSQRVEQVGEIGFAGLERGAGGGDDRGRAGGSRSLGVRRRASQLLVGGTGCGSRGARLRRSEQGDAAPRATRTRA